MVTGYPVRVSKRTKELDASVLVGIAGVFPVERANQAQAVQHARDVKGVGVLA